MNERIPLILLVEPLPLITFIQFSDSQQLNADINNAGIVIHIRAGKSAPLSSRAAVTPGLGRAGRV